MADLLVSHLPVEVLYSQTPAAEVAHLPVEVLYHQTPALQVAHLPVEVAWSPQPELWVAHLCLELLRPTYEEEIFEPGQNFGPLVWVEVAGPDAVTRGYAPVALPDPASYYRGWKPAEMVAAGRMARALSDEQGQYEAQRFGVTLSDMASRQWRTWLGDPSTRQLLNRLIVMRMISVEAWRAKLRPRTVGVGYVRDYRLE